MGRLSHIEDIEKKNEQQGRQNANANMSLDDLYQASPAAGQATQSAQRVGAKPGQPQVQERAQQQTVAAQRSAASQRSKATKPEGKATAQSEADFHGLNDIEKTSGGHLALIALSVVVLVAIIFYIFNYMS